MERKGEVDRVLGELERMGELTRGRALDRIGELGRSRGFGDVDRAPLYVSCFRMKPLPRERDLCMCGLPRAEGTRSCRSFST